MCANWITGCQSLETVDQLLFVQFQQFQGQDSCLVLTSIIGLKPRKQSWKKLKSQADYFVPTDANQVISITLKGWFVVAWSSFIL